MNSETPLRLLVVEDHQDIAANIGDFFSARGHVMDYAMDGVGGLHLALTNDYDAIVLDINLPRMDGLSVCQKLRESGETTPVVMLTARDTVPDKLEGFRSGTDDYLTKPFALVELEARLSAIVRRARPAGSATVLRAGDLVLDLATLEARRSGVRLELTPSSLSILTELLRASPGVVTKSRLEHVLWGDCPSGPDALRTQMYALRRVVDKPFAAPMIHTVHGIGYRLVLPDGNDGPNGNDAA